MKKVLLVLPAFMFSAFAFAQSNRTSMNAPGNIIENQGLSVQKSSVPHTMATACDTLNYPINPSWTQVYYTTGTNGSGGFVNGPNQYNDKEKANYFDASASPYGKLQGMLIAFSHVYSANTSKIVTIRIYDGTSGSPGATLGTKNLTIAQIMAYSSQNYFTQVIFSPAINLPASKKFFVSVDVSNLSWSALPKDSLAINSNSDPQSMPTTTWEKQSNNTWYRYDDAVNSWNLNITLYIFPFITNTPYAISYTQNPTSNTPICSGTSVNYDASASIIGSGLLWNFQGGLPANSTQVMQSVQYPAAGTYTTKLYILGGGCDVYDSLSSTVNVIASPTLSPTANPMTICPPNTTSTLTVSGANTYAWTPSSTLSSSTGSTVTATPTATTTYSVTGTASNGCTSTASVQVTLGQNPSVSATSSNPTICVGNTVSFNASASQNVTIYSWVFPGGTPASSNSPTPTITYNSPGTFIAHLYASNNCGVDSSFTVSVSVGCVGLTENNLDEQVKTYFNHASGQFEMNISNSNLNGNYSVSIVNALGQEIYRSNAEISGNANIRVDMNKFSTGIYFVRINGTEVNFSRKFIKE
ncbi:MAG TPA: PKD domain-containing protein [Bacteroidia bacterium]